MEFGSLDREPYDTDPAAVFSELEPGNLEFVTGFEGGATMYDPNGLAFLNTLNAIEGGRGYWVKVTQDDELRVPAPFFRSLTKRRSRMAGTSLVSRETSVT